MLFRSNWSESGRLLVESRVRRASQFRRGDYVLYSFESVPEIAAAGGPPAGTKVRAVGIVVGVPGDRVRFREIPGVEFLRPDQRSLKSFVPVVNGRALSAADHPAFARPLVGLMPSGEALVREDALFVLNPSLEGATVDSRAFAAWNFQIPDVAIRGRVVASLP